MSEVCLSVILALDSNIGTTFRIILLARLTWINIRRLHLSRKRSVYRVLIFFVIHFDETFAKKCYWSNRCVFILLAFMYL